MLNENIYNFILLNIQNENWKENEKIPSERSLSIKFNVSKNTINKILNNMVENNIIYSKPQKGFFVSKNKGFFFLSSSKNHEKITFKKSAETLQELDLEKINNYFKIDQNIDFWAYEKNYLIKDQRCKKILIFINKKLKNSENFIKTSDQNWPIYKWFAQNSYAIFKWIYLETYVESLDITEKVSSSGIKIFFNGQGEILAILKIMDFFRKNEVNNVFLKSLID